MGKKGAEVLSGALGLLGPRGEDDGESLMVFYSFVQCDFTLYVAQNCLFGIKINTFYPYTKHIFQQMFFFL